MYLGVGHHELIYLGVDAVIWHHFNPYDVDDTTQPYSQEQRRVHGVHLQSVNESINNQTIFNKLKAWMIRWNDRRSYERGVVLHRDSARERRRTLRLALAVSAFFLSSGSFFIYF